VGRRLDGHADRLEHFHETAKSRLSIPNCQNAEMTSVLYD
jgi:hypothetical protein